MPGLNRQVVSFWLQFATLVRKLMLWTNSNRMEAQPLECSDLKVNEILCYLGLARQFHKELKLTARRACRDCRLEWTIGLPYQSEGPHVTGCFLANNDRRLLFDCYWKQTMNEMSIANFKEVEKHALDEVNAALREKPSLTEDWYVQNPILHSNGLEKLETNDLVKLLERCSVDSYEVTHLTLTREKEHYHCYGRLYGSMPILETIIKNIID